MEDPTDTAPAAASDHPERSKATSRTIWLSLGGIALAAGTASYLRTLGVIQAVDGRSIMAYFEALLADPTIAAASVNIVDARRRDAKMPWFSLVSILVAAVVTLGANVVYGDPHPLPKWLVNVWPPVAFLLAFESLMSFVRRGHEKPAKGGTATESHENPCLHGVAGTLDEAVRRAWAHDIECNGFKPTFVAFEARFGMSRKRVAELVKGPAPEMPEPSLNGSGPGA
jgi:hypothetical protein